MAVLTNRAKLPASCPSCSKAPANQVLTPPPFSNNKNDNIQTPVTLPMPRLLVCLHACIAHLGCALDGLATASAPVDSASAGAPPLPAPLITAPYSGGFSPTTAAAVAASTRIRASSTASAPTPCLRPPPWPSIMAALYSYGGGASPRSSRPSSCGRCVVPPQRVHELGQLRPASDDDEGMSLLLLLLLFALPRPSRFCKLARREPRGGVKPSSGSFCCRCCCCCCWGWW